MTLATITHEVGWQDDCGDASDYSETEDGMTATLTVDNGTIFNINVSAAVGNKKVYYEIDVTDFDGTIYPEVLIKYKTSSTSIKAKVEVVYDDATTEVPIAETASTDWTTATGTLADNKTIDKIRLYATSATGDVYIDFITIFKDTFSFPDFTRIIVNPKPKLAILPIPGSDTDVVQLLGRANTEITIEGEMLQGETWGGSNLTYGEYLMNILADRYFQWLTTDQGNFKVVPDPAGFQFIGEPEHRLFSLKFQEYDVGDASGFGNPAWYGK